MRSETVAARRRLYLLTRVIVARHYRRRLTLALVAGSLSSSPRQIQRAYEQFGEISFHEDLLTRRMAVAAQLLIEQPGIAVADVARLVGYQQASHFARVFRRRYGHPPARFRERARDYRAAMQASSAQSGGVQAGSPDAPAREDMSAVESDGSKRIVSAPGRRMRMSVPPPGACSAVTNPPC